MREREALAQDGFVIVNLRVNKAGKLVEKPEIISRGFVFVRDAEEMFAAAQEQIALAAAKANGAAASPQALRDKVQHSLADFFYAELKRRPMIFALVNQV
jgi:ribonuclease J